MKKLLFLLFVSLMTISAFAEKKYITINVDDGTVELYGDLPATIKSKYKASELGSESTAYKTLPYILDILSNEGYCIEQQLGTSYRFLLSKTVGSSASTRAEVVESGDGIHEVARYNLQGQPVDEKEKGIQIIVYSNYTTKTVIVE